jgi:hypothetical protein
MAKILSIPAKLNISYSRDMEVGRPGDFFNSPNNMKRRHIYLILAITGTVIPLYHFYSFLFEYGVDVYAFLRQMFKSPISSLFGWDVVISSITVITFITIEGRRLKVSHWWVYIILNFMVGVSLALSAFLYQREIVLEMHKKNAS